MDKAAITRDDFDLALSDLIQGDLEGEALDNAVEICYEYTSDLEGRIWDLEHIFEVLKIAMQEFRDHEEN